MNGYSKISTATTHKPRSMDFSDFLSLPPLTSKPQQEQEPNYNEVKKSKIQHPVPEAAERERELDGGGNGERFGVILGRSGSVSSASGFQSTVKRAFSMRRSSSVSERYCRIHDQYMAIASPIAIADHEIDDDDDGNGIWTRRSSMKKKKLRGGKIFKAYLMKKVGGMVEGGDMVLKYQLIPEDLDALVSVRTDEDLKHMIDEHDRHESGGAPLLRAFLFPSKPVLLENHAAAAAATASETYVLEQRYIDAINGIIRTSPKSRLNPIRAFSTSSACSSPKSNSPDGHTADLVHESPFPSSGRVAMHRVRSSPSITSLSNLHTSSIQQHDHAHYHNQSHHLVGYPSSSRQATQDPQVGTGMGRPPPIVSLGVGGKTDISRGMPNYYYSPSRPQKVFAYYDDSAAYAHPMVERLNVPRSPRKSIWE